MTARRRPPPIDAAALPGGREPLYVALARTLKDEIDKGRWAVGESLPTEGALAQRHGVSRHTVRQALRELKDAGMIQARAGIGTKVRARPEASRFFTGIHSITDLLQFVEATEMKVLARQALVADARTAPLLRCAPGQHWHELDIVRGVPGDPLPLCYLQVFVPPQLAPALGRAPVIRQPIYSLIEKRYGLRIVEVLQEITASNLTEAMAVALKAQPGQSALRISRYYHDRDGALLQVSIGHYPSGRYTQSTRFRAQGAEADMGRAGYGQETQ